MIKKIYIINDYRQIIPMDLIGERDGGDSTEYVFIEEAPGDRVKVLDEYAVNALNEGSSLNVISVYATEEVALETRRRENEYELSCIETRLEKLQTK
jgi:hypothetical protein